MDDLISRQAAINASEEFTKDCNPEHFVEHQKFIEFMDNAEIGSFGNWQFANGFNMGLTAAEVAIKDLPSAHRWIPVTERLPKLDEDVLLCYIEHDRWRGQYVSVGQGKRFTLDWVEDGEDENEVEWEWVFADDLVHLVEVKYWMPLPEPPKGEDNDC